MSRDLYGEYIRSRFEAQQVYNDKEQRRAYMWASLAAGLVSSVGSYYGAVQGRCDAPATKIVIDNGQQQSRGPRTVPVRCAYCRRERTDRMDRCKGCGASEVLR